MKLDRSSGVRSDASRRRFVESIDVLIDSKVGDGVYSVSCKRAADCNLDESIFVDYGHLTFEGARALTNELFDRIHALSEER